jgi:hypothetical protein
MRSHPYLILYFKLVLRGQALGGGHGVWVLSASRRSLPSKSEASNGRAATDAANGAALPDFQTGRAKQGVRSREASGTSDFRMGWHRQWHWLTCASIFSGTEARTDFASKSVRACFCDYQSRQRLANLYNFLDQSLFDQSFEVEVSRIISRDPCARELIPIPFAASGFEHPQ